MFKHFRDKIALSGVTVLGIGVALLVVTFLSAYGFLTAATSPSGSGGLEQIFGAALAPLIGAAMRIMYLGVMGWIGSIVTIRGVTIIANVQKVEALVPQKLVVTQPKPAPPPKAKAESQKEIKPEAKPPEREIVVIPPEEIAQQPPAPQQKQENNSQPPQSSS